MTIVANSFEDLRNLENEKYKIDVEKYANCAWIINKETGERVQYLSTHTFYENSYKRYEAHIRKFNFDVTLEKGK